jgi:hypothetical protein
MRAILENGGLVLLLHDSLAGSFQSLRFFNKILDQIFNANSIEELALLMGTLYAYTRLHNGNTPFTYGFNEEKTQMEVYQDGNPKCLILVKSEE